MTDSLPSNELLKRCRDWFAAYMHERENFDEAAQILAAIDNTKSGRSGDEASPVEPAPTARGSLPNSLATCSPDEPCNEPVAWRVVYDGSAHVWSGAQPPQHNKDLPWEPLYARPAPPPSDDTAMRDALVHAVSVIQTWHNMEIPMKDRSELWDIYWRNAPEMDPIRAALTKGGEL